MCQEPISGTLVEENRVRFLIPFREDNRCRFVISGNDELTPTAIFQEMTN